MINSDIAPYPKPETSEHSEISSLARVVVSASSGSDSTGVETLRKAMSEILPLFDLPEAEFMGEEKRYVSSRVEFLSAQSRVDYIAYETSVEEFISPTTDIDAHFSEGIFDLRPFRLDDAAMYTGLLPALKTRYARYLKDGRNPEDAFFTVAVLGAEEVQRRYFGNKIGQQNSGKIVDILSEDIGDNSQQEPFVSISALKDSPMCLQRAVVEHNLLKVLGVDSTLTKGTLTFQLEDKEPKTEHHAFLIVNNENGDPRIIDPQNPILKKRIAQDGTVSLIGASTRSIPITPGKNHYESVGVHEVIVGSDGSETRSQVRLNYELVG